MASIKGGANRALKNSSNFRKYNRLVRETVYHRIKNGVEVETIKPPVWWHAIKKAVPPSVIQYQDYSNESIKFKFDTVFPTYNEAWKEAGHEPDLEWDSMYGKPSSFLLRLQIRLIEEGLPIHEAYERAFEALKKEKEEIDMKMEQEREWLEQREYDTGKQSNSWDANHDEAEGVKAKSDDGTEVETSSFSKLLLAAKNRKKMGKLEAMALEGDGDSSSEIFARFKSLEGGEEGPISDAEKLVNAVGGQSLITMLSKDTEQLQTFLREMDVEEAEIQRFVATLKGGHSSIN